MVIRGWDRLTENYVFLDADKMYGMMEKQSVVETLKCSLRVTRGHWKCYYSKALVRFPVRIP